MEDHLDYISGLIEDHCFDQAEDELNDLLDRDDLTPEVNRRALTLAKLCARTLYDSDSDYR